jgi:hypothetical protein
MLIGMKRCIIFLVRIFHTLPVICLPAFLNPANFFMVAIFFRTLCSQCSHRDDFAYLFGFGFFTC